MHRNIKDIVRPRNKKDGIESEMIEEKTGAMKESGDLISLEANKIVNQLLDDIVYISDEEGHETDSEVNLEEIDKENPKEAKMKYYECDYEVEASRKYLALRLLLHHKDSCCENKMRKKRKTTKCNQCDFTINESVDMKRHMRDIHLVKTDSTSPPPKKKKSVTEELNDKIEEMEAEVSPLDDLSFTFEDMEIDTEKDEPFDERSLKWMRKY